MKKIFIPALFACAALASCEKSRTMTCTNEAAGVKFTGFRSAELRRIELHHYASNIEDSLVLQSVDTFYLGDEGYSYNDSIAILENVIQDTNAKFAIVLNSRSYLVDGIGREAQHDEEYISQEEQTCVNRFLYYNLNGVPQLWSEKETNLLIKK